VPHRTRDSENFVGGRDAELAKNLAVQLEFDTQDRRRPIKPLAPDFLPVSGAGLRGLNGLVIEASRNGARFSLANLETVELLSVLKEVARVGTTEKLSALISRDVPALEVRVEVDATHFEKNGAAL
jgi:hypothetical protein